MIDELKHAAHLFASGDAFAMVTVVETADSVPTRVGDRMIVTENNTSGTVGGGALEQEATRQARELLKGEGRGQLLKICVADIGMKCGGEVALFIEPFRPETELWIFGGGHIAFALVPVAASIGFAITVVDNRSEFADPARFPHARRVIFGEYEDKAKEVPEKAFVAIMTHGHAHDEVVLREIARRDPPLPYVGMIGSAKKVPLIFQHLASEGIQISDNVYSPIGLDLGGNSPAQIALSIAAECLAVRHGKDALAHCRERIKWPRLNER